MTDPVHLNEIISNTVKPLSRKLVETFREAARDPSVSKADYAQRLKNEMEAAVQEGQPNAATESNSP